MTTKTGIPRLIPSECFLKQQFGYIFSIVNRQTNKETRFVVQLAIKDMRPYIFRIF